MKYEPINWRLAILILWQHTAIANRISFLLIAIVMLTLLSLFGKAFLWDHRWHLGIGFLIVHVTVINLLAVKFLFEKSIRGYRLLIVKIDKQ